MAVIVRDTRDVPGKHRNVDDFLTAHGHTLVRTKLYVGDVAFLNNQSICIDLKGGGVLELAMDMFQQHDRFRRELQKAQEAQIQLIILVEEELPKGGLAYWKSPKYKSNTPNHKRGEPISKVNPVILRKAMLTMQEKYGVKFRFCPKDEAGQYVIDYLEGKRQ